MLLNHAAVKRSIHLHIGLFIDTTFISMQWRKRFCLKDEILEKAACEKEGVFGPFEGRRRLKDWVSDQ
jgi:hypothetical protein